MKRVPYTLTSDQTEGLKKAAKDLGLTQASEVLRNILFGYLPCDIWRNDHVLRGNGNKNGTSKNPDRSPGGGEAETTGTTSGGRDREVDQGEQAASGTPGDGGGQKAKSKLATVRG